MASLGLADFPVCQSARERWITAVTPCLPFLSRIFARPELPSRYRLRRMTNIAGNDAENRVVTSGSQGILFN